MKSPVPHLPYGIEKYGMECSMAKHYIISRTKYPNGNVPRRAVRVREPMPKMQLGENSNIPDTKCLRHSKVEVET
jgi:hypothetical protein